MAIVAAPPTGAAHAPPDRVRSGTLDATGVLDLLRELDLIAVADVVGGLVVTDVSRRNRNYR
ncbi:hypothetical protein ACFVX9_39840, partial [Kitasatospora sp. NPDC058243]|uniref:hypothetical protein n=1 Tax=Kitasatospora sp. NPDC058243 TaxID=3346397 RepID=UPI0036DE639B